VIADARATLRRRFRTEPTPKAISDYVTQHEELRIDCDDRGNLFFMDDDTEPLTRRALGGRLRRLRLKAAGEPKKAGRSHKSRAH
jgi:hypothetical protein